MSHQDQRMDGSNRTGEGSDAWLDALLRADAATQAHVADDGFASRVMTALPPPRRPAPRWIVPAAAVLGCVVAVGLTPAGAWFARNLTQLVELRSLSLAHLAVLVPLALFYAMSFSALRPR